MAANVNFDGLIKVVEEHASNYEAALIELENSASSSGGSGGNPGSVNITEATVATTRVQLTQSLTEGIRNCQKRRRPRERLRS